MLTTRINVLKSAKEEFLAKGYENSSLRIIAKNAGVTTGAIYGLFSSKNEMFKALVSETREGLLKLCDENIIRYEENFELASTEERYEMRRKATLKYIDYIYKNLDNAKLLLCLSQGTDYGNFLNEHSEKYVKGMSPILKKMKKEGKIEYVPSKEELLLMAAATYNSAIEMLRLNMTKRKAAKYSEMVCKFTISGFDAVVGFNGKK